MYLKRTFFLLPQRLLRKEINRKDLQDTNQTPIMEI